MSDVVVCGAGMIGLCVAMMFADDGHDVTVLEADPYDIPTSPDEAWERWPRKGVAQFHQPHNLFSRFREICDTDLPGLTDRLAAAGCVWVDYLRNAPPSLAGSGPRPGDDRIPFVTGRRPVLEYVVATAAAEHPQVTIRRGVRVAGLRVGADALPGVPHVAGVRTSTGEQLRADLVVDAGGRKSASAAWLADHGARPLHIESEDCGFVYYTRYFSGPVRPRLRAGALTPLGTISLLTLDGDNDTWSLTLFTQTGDAPLKSLRDPEVFTRVVRACPLQEHWLDGTPITDVLPMAGILDRYRRFVVDGMPIVTGLAAVGDAWACTNPSAGRGLSIGLIHAQQLRTVAQKYLDDPAGFAYAWDEHTERLVAPFYRNQIAADKIRIAEMAALREGRQPPPMDPDAGALMAAASHEPDVFRALLETVLCLGLPQEVFARPAVREKIDAYRDADLPPATPGPDRAQLLELIAG